MQWDTSTVSVISSAAVAVAGIALPALMKRGDRKHERMLLTHQRVEAWRAEWWMQRQKVYEEALRLGQHIRMETRAIAEGRPWVPPDDPVTNVGPHLDAWGSRAVGIAFSAFWDTADPVHSLENEDRSASTMSVALAIIPELLATYAAMARIINEELAEGPENAAP